MKVCLAVLIGLSFGSLRNSIQISFMQLYWRIYYRSGITTCIIVPGLRRHYVPGEHRTNTEMFCYQLSEPLAAQ